MFKKDLYQEGRIQTSHLSLIIKLRDNKIVISACSPVFKKIIDSNPSQHPLIYLRGVQSYEVESILQFMYLGEGRFYHERMGEFIKVAKDLEVKGISNGVEMGSGEEDNLDEDCYRSEHEGVKYPCHQCDYQATEKGSLQSHIIVKHRETVLKCDDGMGDGEKEVLDKIDSDDQTKETLINEDHQSEELIEETTTEKKLPVGTSTQCPECGLNFSRRSTMFRHVRRKHVMHPCDKCDYEAKDKSCLKKHIKSQHESSRYLCEQCDYEATTNSSLRQHIKSKHEDIKYPCDQCDYQAPRRYTLQTHIAAKHNNAVVVCDKCDYQTKWRSNLYTHQKSHNKPQATKPRAVRVVYM